MALVGIQKEAALVVMWGRMSKDFVYCRESHSFRCLLSLVLRILDNLLGTGCLCCLSVRGALHEVANVSVEETIVSALEALSRPGLPVDVST